MSREIKFRAWIQADPYSDDENPKMEMTTNLAFEEYEPINDLLASQQHLMQYTGLKDKNGVEIYEGDIVSSQSMPNSPIEYQRGSFNGAYADDEWEDPFWRYTVAVIGNVYENPELLEEKQ